MGIVTSVDFLPKPSSTSSLILDFFLLLGFGDGSADNRVLKPDALFPRVSAGAIVMHRGGVGDGRARIRDARRVDGGGGKASMGGG